MTSAPLQDMLRTGGRMRDFIVISIGLGLGFCFAMMMANSIPDEWETLVVGALAVLAAFVTVREMQKTDKAQNRRHEETVRQMIASEERQQNRHEQLVGLSLRADRLKVLRAHTPRVENIRILMGDDAARRAVVTDGLRQIEEAKDLASAERARALQEMLSANYQSWKQVVRLSELNEVRPLFDAFMNRSWQDVTDADEHFRNALGKVAGLLDIAAVKEAIDNIPAASDAYSEAVKRAGVLADALDQLAAQYR